MYDDFQALAVEDFGRWLTPPQAISALSHLKMEDAARQIWKRVEHDIMKAAAARIVFPNGGRAERAIVPTKWWRLEAPLVKLGFWDTGDIELAESSGSYGLPDKLVAALFGVRFDPAGIAELAPASSPSVAADPPPPEHLAESLPDPPTAAEFEQWWHPSDAVNQFYALGDDQAREAVRSLLGAGVIQAAAEKQIIGDKVLGLSTVLKAVWPLVRDERFGPRPTSTFP